MNKASNQNSTVTIHGDVWKLSDIADEVAWCRQRIWERRRWTRGPALVHKKGGRVSFYYGQKYDPDKIDLVTDGWSHDHCRICWWALREEGPEEQSVGYAHEGSWICSECYEQFIRPAIEQSGEPGRGGRRG